MNSISIKNYLCSRTIGWCLKSKVRTASERLLQNWLKLEKVSQWSLVNLDFKKNMCVAVKRCYQFKILTSSIFKHILLSGQKIKKIPCPKISSNEIKIIFAHFFLQSMSYKNHRGMDSPWLEAKLLTSSHFI